METSSTATQPIVDYSRPSATRAPRFNLRMFVFVGVFVALFGTLAYLYLETTLTHGIQEGKDGYLRVDLKSMSTFAFDQQFGTVEDIPPVYRELDGKKVSLVGQMWVGGSRLGEVGQFDLVYSISKCCFTGAPQIQHFVKSRPVDNRPLPFYEGDVRVKGTLKVNVTKDPDGKITGVYHLAVESVEPV